MAQIFMTMAKKTNKTDEQFAAVEQTLGRTEQWVENNQKQLLTFIFSAVGIIAIYLGYQQFYLEPLNEDALGEMFVAEKHFGEEAYDLALNGDGQYLGFLDIIDSYESTDAANLAQYYSGVCYLKQGDFESAIEYLTKFSSDDAMVSSIAYGNLGDAYWELGDTDKAINYFEKAGYNSNNAFTGSTYLLRAALAHESQGEYKNALNIYDFIKENYPDTQEGQEIEKYITRATSLK